MIIIIKKKYLHFNINRREQCEEYLCRTPGGFKVNKETLASSCMCIIISCHIKYFLQLWWSIIVFLFSLCFCFCSLFPYNFCFVAAVFLSADFNSYFILFVSMCAIAIFFFSSRFIFFLFFYIIIHITYYIYSNSLLFWLFTFFANLLMLL